MSDRQIEIADYDAAQDAAAVTRIWREVGWIDAEHEKLVPRLFECGRAVVLRIDDSAECAVHTVPGAMQYLREDLRLSAVTAVTTSHVARRIGAAGRLTALALANAAQDGAEVAALGMFDQGFYDRLGFGSGPYAHEFTFDPATLNVAAPFRPPHRITPRNWQAVHDCMTRRKRGHAGCVLAPPEIVECEFGWTDDPFGLGYHDGEDGALSHFIWGEAPDEHGPYRITWLGYQTVGQLMELLALIRSLGDQVSAVKMLEPPDIQLQDTLRQPFRNRRGTQGGKYANWCHGVAYWQLRMLDLPKCLAKTRLSGPDLAFNLKLHDPAPERVDSGAGWPGAGGDFTVTLGGTCGAEHGLHPNLPTVTASVGALSRLWIGAVPASTLALTDAIEADTALLEALDDKFTLPTPHLGWDF